jgi:hypothetical protein
MTLAVVTFAGLLASCGNSSNARTKPSTTPTTIVLGEPVASEVLSGDLKVVDVEGGTRIIVPRGAVTDGTKMEVRPVKGFSGIGALTAGPVYELSLSAGRQLRPMQLMYPIAQQTDMPPPVGGVFDRTSGAWTKIDADYDPARSELTVPIAKPAAFGYLQWDWAKALDGGRRAVDGLAVTRPAAEAAKCAGESEILGRFNVNVSTDSSLSWCEGREQSHDVVRVVNRGKIPVAVRAVGLSTQAKRYTDGGFIDQLAAAATPLFVKGADETVEILAPGSELVLVIADGASGGSVRAEVDGYSQFVSSVAAAASYALSLFAGNGVPADQLLRNDTELRASLALRLASAECARPLKTIDEQLRPTVELATFVAHLVTTCIDAAMITKLGDSSNKLNSSSLHGNFGPGAVDALPANFAEQVTASVAQPLLALTERPGSHEIGSVSIAVRDASTSTIPQPQLPPTPTTRAIASPPTSEGPPATDAPTTVPTTEVTVPPTEPTTSTTSVATTTPTTTAPTTTTTVASSPTTIIDTMGPSLKRSDYLLCASSDPASRASSIIGQPFVVPNGVTKLVELGLGVGTGSGGGATSFIADVTIARLGRSIKDVTVLSEQRAVINGQDWTVKLDPSQQVAVKAGDNLIITVTVASTTGDASAVALALVPDGQPGVDNALASNTCATQTTNRRGTVPGSLAVRVVGD